MLSLIAAPISMLVRTDVPLADAASFPAYSQRRRTSPPTVTPSARATAGTIMASSRPSTMLLFMSTLSSPLTPADLPSILRGLPCLLSLPLRRKRGSEKPDMPPGAFGPRLNGDRRDRIEESGKGSCDENSKFHGKVFHR